MERAYVTNLTNQNYKFTGKERDVESGLDNFGARYDSSSLGRFMTPDWAERPTAVPYAVLGDPQSLNLYAYVRNDPVSRADDDGHSSYYVGGMHTGVDMLDEILDVLMSQFNRYDKKFPRLVRGGALQKGKPKKKAQKATTFTIQVIGKDGKRHNVPLKIGSQVLVMHPQPGTIDPGSGAHLGSTIYKVNNVKTDGLTPETKPTEVRMKETITSGSSNCSTGCSNTSSQSDYRNAQITDVNSVQNGPSVDFTQQYFIGNNDSPATLLRPIPNTGGAYDMGTRTHVTETRTDLSVRLEE